MRVLSKQRPLTQLSAARSLEMAPFGARPTRRARGCAHARASIGSNSTASKSTFYCDLLPRRRPRSLCADGSILEEEW